MSCVYLLHIDPPFGHAAHYIGFSNASNPTERFKTHLRGQGANLTKQAVKAGHKLSLIHWWPKANQKFERLLKFQGAKTICPVCGGTPPALTAEDATFINKGKH